MSKIKLEKRQYDIFELVNPKLVKKVQKLYEKYQHYIPEPGDKPIITLIGDEYEELMNSYGYKCKGQGTNRSVYYFDDKYKDVCIKLACDKHGTEANRRESVNSKTEISKYLTYVYAIDAMGTIIVEEMVTPFLYLNENGKDKWGNDYREYEDDIRAMLEKLKKKLLLVDCKISNFCNFGLRKDGSVCLLDHGDLVPLSSYQTGDTVNEEEEAFVTLTCKSQVDETDPKSKLCGGKLKYSPNYDYLYCTVCHKAYHVNDAYRMPFKWRQEGYHEDKKEGHLKFTATGVEFVTDDEDEAVEPYIPECVLQEKVIDNNICIPIKDYWIPEKYFSGLYSMYKIKIESGKINPEDFLKKFGIENTDIYKVSKNKEDNFMEQPKSEAMEPIAKKFNSLALSSFKQNPVQIKYSDVGTDARRAAEVKNYMLAHESRYHSIRYDNEKQSFVIYFTYDYINKSIRPMMHQNNTNKQHKEEKKMSGSMNAFASFKKHVDAEETVSRKVNDNSVEATVHYVVHGMVCARSSDYYLPVKFYKPNLTHDETKAILKSEGYTPKDYKIENNPGAQAVSKVTTDSLYGVMRNNKETDDDDFDDLRSTPESSVQESDDNDSDSIIGEDVIIRPESTLYSTDEDDEEEIEEEIVVPQDAIQSEPEESQKEPRNNDRVVVYKSLINDAALYRNIMEKYGGIDKYIAEHFPEVDEKGRFATDRFGFPGIELKSNITTIINLVINDSEKYTSSIDNGTIIIESLAFLKLQDTIDAANRICDPYDPSKELSDYNHLTLDKLKPEGFEPDNTDYNKETYANAEAIISTLVSVKCVSETNDEDVDKLNESCDICDELFSSFAETILNIKDSTDNATDFYYQACVAIVGTLRDFCSSNDHGFRPEIIRYLCKVLDEEYPEAISSINEYYGTSITANSAFANMDTRKPVLTEDIVIHRIKKEPVVEETPVKEPEQKVSMIINKEIEERINSAPDKTEAIKSEIAALRKKLTEVCIDLDTLVNLL